MTLLTQRRIRFGSVVEHKRGRIHFLVVGWRTCEKTDAVCARPDGSEYILPVATLVEVRPPQRWVPCGKR